MAITPGGTQITLPAPNNICSWPVTAATSGTDTACTNGTAYYVSVFVPGNCLITSVGYLIGSVGGTDKAIASIYDSGGTLLANSAAAGATVGTAANTQLLDLTTPLNYIGGPGTILVALTFNGTTAKFRSIPAFCSNGVWAGSATQTFGTVTSSITVSTTLFTADKGPVIHLR